MATSYVTFVQNLQDLDITGVLSKKKTLPPKLAEGDLPASWVQDPEGT